MKHRLGKLQINKVALVDAGAGKGVKVAIWKSKGGKSVRKGDPMNLDQLLAAAASLSDEDKAKLAAALGLTSKMEGEEKKPEDPVAKARQEAKTEMEAELKKRDERIAKLERDRVKAELLGRVSKSMSGLEGTPEEIAEELLAVSDESAREKLAKRWESASASRVELLKKSGMLKAIGSTRTGEPIAPADEFDELVAKAMKDEGIKKKSDAISVIAKRRPELYEAVKAAHTQKEAV